VGQSGGKPRAEEKAMSEGRAGDKPSRKRPYKKPEFRYEKVFETSALACWKTLILPLQCTVNMKNS